MSEVCSGGTQGDSHQTFSVALFMLVRDQRESEMSPCIRALGCTVLPKYRVLTWMAEGNILVNVGDYT